MDKKFWKHKKVLITGRTGFKGSWLSLWLLNLGANVYGYSLKPNEDQKLFNDLFVKNNKINKSFSNLNHFIGDINDSIKLSSYIQQIKPDIVFHLAAQPLVRKSYENPIQTWQTNVIGTLNLLEALKSLNNFCAAIMITTDKVYENKEWIYGYRENDSLGGIDPYSSSKASMEIAISSWRESFCGLKPNQNSKLAIASARAGNVIGGGDWSQDRLVPDIIKSLKNKSIIKIRNPNSRRPWQHVLEPLAGYLLLSEKLFKFQTNSNKLENIFASSFNFGPSVKSNKTVEELVKKVLNSWPGEWVSETNTSEFHEAKLLNLISEKSKFYLDWESIWDFEETIFRTINWYKKTDKGQFPYQSSMEDLMLYQTKLDQNNL